VKYELADWWKGSSWVAHSLSGEPRFRVDAGLDVLATKRAEGDSCLKEQCRAMVIFRWLAVDYTGI